MVLDVSSQSDPVWQHVMTAFAETLASECLQCSRNRLAEHVAATNHELCISGLSQSCDVESKALFRFL